MPTEFKLVYLNGRGRAENSRMMLALADQKYEDVRYEMDEFPKHKSSTPFGQVPVLFVNDVEFCQSKAIDMCLARLLGFAGKTLLEETRVDMLNHCVQDMVDILLKTSKMSDSNAMGEAIKKFGEEQFPDYLVKMNKLLEQNISESGFFVGNGITLADISFVNGLDWPPLLGITVDLDKYPKLKSLRQIVVGNSRIAAWIAKRPETGF